MGHLFRQSGDAFTTWSNGFSSYLTDYKQGPCNLLVAIECRLGNLEETDIALLDTGAEWSVISQCH